MHTTLKYGLTLAACLCVTGPAIADHGSGPLRADDHAPIGVMGDHTHKAGEFMLSYRYMRMYMDGNLDGTDDLSPVEIATTIANPFAPPPTLRVVPLDMTMEMHMVGAMYAPTDWLTLMAMGMYVRKEMDHVTFQGGMGDTVLGYFTTVSSGIGDTKVSALVRLYKDDRHHVHLNAGLSLPTGSITEEDDVLAPTNARPTLRLPYPMQLGSGTVDALPGITYTGKTERMSWGAQYMAAIRIGENDEGYAFGDRHEITAWAAYPFAPWISSSLRLTASTQDAIEGRDLLIGAPVQTADPANQGGERVDLGFGVNLMGQTGVVRGQRVALEFVVPVHQDLNGPQLETDWTLTAGWQYAF